MKTKLRTVSQQFIFLFVIFWTKIIRGEETINCSSVLMVSSNNICRSPIAAAVFRDLAKKKGVDSQWYCESAGIDTRALHGRLMDPRAMTTLQNHGIEPANVTTRQLNATDFKRFDYIFAMDGANLADLLNRKKWCSSKSTVKIDLLTSYDPEGASIIRNPFVDDGMGGFEECYAIAYRSCNAFLDKFSKLIT